MSIADWFKTELKPIEAGLVILVLALIGWQIWSYGERRAASAIEQVHHEQVMQQVASLGDQVKAAAASKAQSDAVAEQRMQALVQQQATAQALVTQFAALQTAAAQHQHDVAQLTPSQIVDELRKQGFTSTLTPAEGQKVLATAAAKEDCDKELNNVTGQLGNCHDQVSTGQQIIQAQRQSLADLAQQVTLEQQIAKATTQDYEQQLKVARGGSRFDRLFKVAEAFAFGYGIRAATHR